jgi:hypothetical protein
MLFTWSIPILILAFLSIILWFWAIIDINRINFKDPKHKSLFFFMVLITPVIGSIIYFQMKKGYVSTDKKKFSSI